MKKRLPLLFLLCSFSFDALSQGGVREEQITTSFSHRVSNPIKIEVVRKNDQLEFSAHNRSFFPYQLQIDFGSLTNIQAEIFKSMVVYPGWSRLFSLKIINTNSPHNYSYKTKYTMGYEKDNPETEFPYLMPLAKGKKFSQVNSSFLVVPGDTIYAMRKGHVTCLPDNTIETDRVMKYSLEVYHADGTLAAYMNLDPDRTFVKYGQKVYPGQPIGIVGEYSMAKVFIFRFFKGGKLGAFPHFYATDATNTISSRANTGTVVSHPHEVIKRELTKNEVKKLNKGTLYKTLPKEESDL